MHMFNVSTLYRQSINFFPSKAVAGVNQPMRALSMHIRRPNEGKIVLVLTAVKLLHQKAVVGVDLPIKALSMHIQKPYK